MAEPKENRPESPDLKRELAYKLADSKIQLEEKRMHGQFQQSARGQYMAFILSVLSIGSSVGVTVMGHDWVGVLFGGVDGCIPSSRLCRRASSQPKKTSSQSKSTATAK